jgi:mannose-1-phosphate guanylyltransferase/mannose-6-phosphate isomerase
MYAVILAGGSGTRLWPLSTKRTPKQFLRLTDQRTMLQQTVDRIETLVPPDHIYVVTFANYREAVAEQLPALPAGNNVAEPLGRGTAASIGLAAALIAARDPQAVMAVFSADHAIADARGFREALVFAEEIARRGALVTLGITPGYPETGFGYIDFGEASARSGSLAAHPVVQFIEKPAREVAERFVGDGHHVWNAGIFVWRVDRILGEIERYLPVVGGVLAEIASAARTTGGRMTPEVERVMQAAWPRIEQTVTIDYGVLEKASGIEVIPVDVGWNDIGSWAQVAALQTADAAGNAAVGVEADAHVEAQSRDNLIFSTTGRPVALAGVSGLVIVDTPDALLVCSKESAQLVKDLAERMQQPRGDAGQASS